MALVAGARAIGADFQNLGMKTHAPLDLGTFTATSYTTTRSGGTSPVGIAFVAPPSGTVKVDWASHLFNSGTGATNYTLIAYQIKTGSVLGSGTTVQAATDNLSLQSTGTTPLTMGTHDLVTGLTPGNNYNVTLMFRVGAGTGTTNRLKVTLAPSIA